MSRQCEREWVQALARVRRGGGGLGGGGSKEAVTRKSPERRFPLSYTARAAAGDCAFAKGAGTALAWGTHTPCSGIPLRPEF